MAVWKVTIYSLSSKSKVDKFETNVESMLQAQRVINTYKTKRGYKITKVIIEQGWWLV